MIKGSRNWSLEPEERRNLLLRGLAARLSQWGEKVGGSSRGAGNGAQILSFPHPRPALRAVLAPQYSRAAAGAVPSRTGDGSHALIYFIPHNLARVCVKRNNGELKRPEALRSPGKAIY